MTLLAASVGAVVLALQAAANVLLSHSSQHIYKQGMGVALQYHAKSRSPAVSLKPPDRNQ